MISFARATSVTPGSCTRISSRLGLTRDARLGHAQLVDAAIDRLQRLIDRLLAQVALDDRLHREFVGAAGERVAVVVGRRRPRRPRPGTASHDRAARRRRGTSSATTTVRPPMVVPPVRQRLAQLLARRRRGQLQRVVGVDPHDEVDAALEVEPELQLHAPQPGGGPAADDIAVRAAGRRRCRRRRRRHDENGDDFPAKILVHGSVFPLSVTTGSWP